MPGKQQKAKVCACQASHEKGRKASSTLIRWQSHSMLSKWLGRHSLTSDLVLNVKTRSSKPEICIAPASNSHTGHNHIIAQTVVQVLRYADKNIYSHAKVASCKHGNVLRKGQRARWQSFRAISSRASPMLMTSALAMAMRKGPAVLRSMRTSET